MPAPEVIRRRVVVHGRVQQVGFRASWYRRALDAGAAGWVRNRDDGTVEAVVEGPVAVVEALVSWAASGPPLARVDALDVTEESPMGESGFAVR